MSDSVRDRLAEALKAHQIERCSIATPDTSKQWGRCTGCDFESSAFPIKGMDWERLHASILADHFADVLLGLDNIAIVALPEIDKTQSYAGDDGEITVWTWPTGVTTDDDSRLLFDDNGLEIGGPTEARAYAADLLAAARVAEEQP